MSLTTSALPVCRHCGRPVIVDDGAPVCLACVYRYGDAARDPERLSDAERSLLAEAHGDVVRLVEVDVGARFYSYWCWSGEWPVGCEVSGCGRGPSGNGHSSGCPESDR